MKRFFVIIVALSLLNACKPGIPKELIQPEKMEDVLYDIHIVDAYTSTFPSQDSARKVLPAYYKGVYKKFGIDSALYQKSIDYYYAHPDLFKEMYDRISKKLIKEKDKKSNQSKVEQAKELVKQPEPINKIDSLKKVMAPKPAVKLKQLIPGKNQEVKKKLTIRKIVTIKTYRK